MKKYVFLVLLFIYSIPGFAAGIDLSSPNHQIKVSVNLSDKIYYSVSFHNQELMKNAFLGLDLSDVQLGKNPRLVKKNYSVINTTIYPKIPLKNSKIPDNCNVLTLSLKEILKLSSGLTMMVLLTVL